ncbi:hypothetical protein [Tenacibaculum aestuariivivum]|uniref:hypothetical protein n=1 Tax=Tenacibaculum aestuariivivum TaxID=2006131 RepID=UPI003AB30BC8
MANELEEETNLIEDCSFVCSTSEIGISGNEVICNASTNTYTLPAGAENYSWQITSGTNLATINNSNTNTVSLTTTSNTTLSGNITL